MERKLNQSVIVAAIALFGCGSGESAAPAPPPATTAPPTAPVAALNGSVTIDDVAVYQAVKVSLVTAGKTVPDLELNAPVIANRPAFVRVFVKANTNFRPMLNAELRVKRAGKDDLVLKDTGKQVMPELDETLLEATFNFPIEAADMTADATFSLKVTAKAAADTLAFPADGGQMSFGAKGGSEVLKVKFVPISYEADVDVAPIVPDLADLNSLRDTLYKMYPVASVDVSVRAPMKWATPIEPDGPGWDELLGGVMQLRRADAVARDVYYVGVLTPKATLDQFCDKGGCILGIAPVATERDISMRAALVLGYESRRAGGTLAQELAHSMGRYHAPCGNPQSIDGDFPYAGGRIGVMGYDILKKELVDPGDRYRDYMSYCGPVWTSDYTYKNVYERIATISAQEAKWSAADDAGAPPPASPSKLVPSFRISADGSVHQGPELEVIAGDGTGEHLDVTYEGASGNVVATGQGLVRRISRTGGSIVIAPQAPSGAARARLRGAGISGVSSIRARAH